jgi:hypothetical protein
MANTRAGRPVTFSGSPSMLMFGSPVIASFLALWGF